MARVYTCNFAAILGAIFLSMQSPDVCEQVDEL